MSLTLNLLSASLSSGPHACHPRPPHSHPGTALTLCTTHVLSSPGNPRPADVQLAYPVPRVPVPARLSLPLSVRTGTPALLPLPSLSAASPRLLSYESGIWCLVIVLFITSCNPLRQEPLSLIFPERSKYLSSPTECQTQSIILDVLLRQFQALPGPHRRTSVWVEPTSQGPAD